LIWSGTVTPPPPGRRALDGEYLVDPPAVEIEHLETPSLMIKTVAYRGQGAEMLQHQPGHGVEVAMLGHRHRQ
jgi:hypothetical protein